MKNTNGKIERLDYEQAREMRDNKKAIKEEYNRRIQGRRSKSYFKVQHDLDEIAKKSA